MTRTLSGSLISNLTKQPTPEPSEPGSHDIEDTIFDDAHERLSSPYHLQDDGDDVTFAPCVGAVQSTPMHANLDDLAVDSEVQCERNDGTALVRLQDNPIRDHRLTLGGADRFSEERA